MFPLSFALLRLLLGASRGVRSSRPDPAEREASADLIYRLKSWPSLPEAGRTAGIYRMLSVMSIRPVNRQWILNCTRMEPRQVEALLRRLVDEGHVEVIDPTRFAGREPLQA